MLKINITFYWNKLHALIFNQLVFEENKYLDTTCLCKSEQSVFNHFVLNKIMMPCRDVRKQWKHVLICEAQTSRDECDFMRIVWEKTRVICNDCITWGPFIWNGWNVIVLTKDFIIPIRLCLLFSHNDSGFRTNTFLLPLCKQLFIFIYSIDKLYILFS